MLLCAVVVVISGLYKCKFYWCFSQHISATVGADVGTWSWFWWHGVEIAQV